MTWRVDDRCRIEIRSGTLIKFNCLRPSLCGAQSDCCIAIIARYCRPWDDRKTDMTTTWNTKFGPRRVRHDPPTLEEAIFAARGLTDDVQQQIEIAAGLMEVPPEEVRAALVKMPPP